MMEELIRVSGIPLGPVRLMGAEIVFQSDAVGNTRGRVWLPLDASNHLIYGKNGVGKSTVVELLRCALTGEAPSINARIDLFIELDENIPLHVRRQKFSLKLIEDVDADSELLDSGASVLELLEEEEEEEEEIYLSIDTQNLVESISKSSFFSTDCVAQGMDFESFNAVQLLIAEVGQQIDAEQFVRYTWDFESEVSLSQARATWLSYCYITDTNTEFEHRDGMLETIAGAYSEAALQNYYCLTPVGTNGAREWEFTVASKLSPDTPKLAALYQLVEDCRITSAMEARDASESLEELVEMIVSYEFLRSALPSDAFTDWESPISQFLGPTPEHSFRKLAPWMEQGPIVGPGDLEWNRLLKVVNLSEAFDYSKWRLETAKKLFPLFTRRGSWTAMFSNKPGQREKLVESSQFDEFQSLVRIIAEALAGMDINVLDIKVQIEDDFHEWISGRALSLQAQDATTGSWVDFAELSSAQRHVISSVLRLLEAKTLQDNGSSPLLIVLGDEPDQNMHQAAIRHFYDFVDESETCSYLSTHSSVALSLPSFSRLHAYRLPSGNLRLMPWMPSLVAKSDDIDLGIDKVALLSAVSLVILVEGAHDEEALTLLLSLAGIRASSQVLVLPWRGHRTMHTIADSYVWMNMTDARMLVVVDNSRAETINKWRTRIIDSIREGRSQSAIARELRESGGLTGEETTLRDLLERTIHNGVTDRVFAFGFSRGDIIEYADSADFGLTRSWDDLRLEYQQSSLRTSFKDWLRSEHGARISTKTVRTAFANLDHLEDDLVNLLNLIDSIS